MPEPPREDPRLTARIRAGDPDTLASVARDSVGPLLRAARAAGLDEQDAWDVVQNTFTVFVEKADRFDGRARVRTWLFGILYRKLKEARRAYWRESATDEPDAFMEHWFDARGRWTRKLALPDSNVAMSQAMAWLETCLDGLPARQRTVFVLREVEQLSADEVGNILDVTRNNIGVMLFRARNALRNCLEHFGLGGMDDVAMQ